MCVSTDTAARSSFAERAATPSSTCTNPAPHVKKETVMDTRLKRLRMSSIQRRSPALRCSTSSTSAVEISPSRSARCSEGAPGSPGGLSCGTTWSTRKHHTAFSSQQKPTPAVSERRKSRSPAGVLSYFEQMQREKSFVVWVLWRGRHRQQAVAD